jgi:hypothetical protein
MPLEGLIQEATQRLEIQGLSLWMRAVVNVTELSSGHGSNQEGKATLMYHCQISRP